MAKSAISDYLECLCVVLHTTSSYKVLPLPTLCHRVRLYISVVVLAGPNEASLRFHGLGHHVIYQTVLIPDAFGLKLSTVFPGHIRRSTQLCCYIWYNSLCTRGCEREKRQSMQSYFARVCIDAKILTSRRSPGRCL